MFVLVAGLVFLLSAQAVVPPDVQLASRAVETYVESHNSRCIGLSCLDGVLLLKASSVVDDITKGVEDTDTAVSESESGSSCKTTTKTKTKTTITRVLSPIKDKDCGSGGRLWEIEEGIVIAVSGWQADCNLFIRQLRKMCMVSGVISIKYGLLLVWVIISIVVMCYDIDIVGYDRRRPGLSNAPLDRKY